MLFSLALTVALLLVVASVVYAPLKGLAAFRDFRRLARELGSGLERISTETGRIEGHLGLAAESGTRLDASLTRLRGSRARLNVLTSALADVQAAVGRVTSVYPRK